MGIAPPTLCTYGNCHTRAEAGSSRCRAHRRPSATARGYTRGWAAYARKWLRMFPWCGLRADGLFHMEHSICAQRGAIVKARVVDHIRSIGDGGDVFDPTNHQSLCYSCNTRKG